MKKIKSKSVRKDFRVVTPDCNENIYYVVDKNGTDCWDENYIHPERLEPPVGGWESAKLANENNLKLTRP